MLEEKRSELGFEHHYHIRGVDGAASRRKTVGITAPMSLLEADMKGT